MFFLVSDTLVSELKSNLSLEKQKCSLLNEEVKIKKGAVERLRSDLENTKEQLQYMKEEKGKNIYLKTEWMKTRGGGYFRNFWVGMCRREHGTLNLYQS